MKYFASLLFVCVLSTGFSQSDFDFFTSADNFFKTHCSNGRVNYAAVKSDANLPKLIEYIQANPSPSGQEKAYLINVYNLFVISNIAIKKSDKAGLLTFQDKIGTMLPASKQNGQMSKILEVLYNQKTAYREPDFSALYTHVRRKITQRSLLLLFTLKSVSFILPNSSGVGTGPAGAIKC